jgi:DNA-binding HxlR family transcriptional regulator
VSRTVHPTVPPRVDDELSELGCSVLEPLNGLTAWAVAHGTDIAQARLAYDEAQAAAESA